MKQPELGRKITDLRKEKGFTQEELVEKCNISVRTIQRIEAGEVMPRSYTVKTILAALDYNFEKIKDEFPEEESPITQNPKSITLINLAFWFGIIYFFLGFIEVYADAGIWLNKEANISNTAYLILKIACLISLSFFYYGFSLTGKLYQNYLLRMSSVMIIIVMTIATLYDIFSWGKPMESDEFFTFIFAIVIGCVFILHGIGIMRLKQHFGLNIAVITGILTIISGATLLIVVGLILLIPVSILQLVLLYRIKQSIS